MLHEEWKEELVSVRAGKKSTEGRFDWKVGMSRKTSTFLKQICVIFCYPLNLISNLLGTALMPEVHALDLRYEFQ